MVSEKQRKAREKFIRDWAGKKRVTKTGKSKRMSNVRKVLKGGDKQYIAWLKTEIKMRTKNPKNFSSDYSRGELRGYKEALKKLTK